MTGYLGVALLMGSAFIALCGLFDTNWRFMLWSVVLLVVGGGLLAMAS